MCLLLHERKYPLGWGEFLVANLDQQLELLLAGQSRNKKYIYGCSQADILSNTILI